LDFGFWILDLRVTRSLTHSRTILFIAIGLILATLSSCRSAEVPSVDVATREVRDDLGRTMNVPLKIDRAISLAPSITEMIFAIGAGDRLVGVTTYCNFPAEAMQIEKVGDTQTPNIEKIIALKPQVVFVSTASQLEVFYRTLEGQGIHVYVTNPMNLEDVFENMGELGDLFGKAEFADNLVTTLNGRASVVRHQANHLGDSDGLEKHRPRAFLQISNDPLFTIGNESFLTELIEQAGGVSVTKDVPTAYPKLSKETAAALDPDVIILSDSDDNREPSSVFKNSKAVTNGRVHRINADIISRPGPRLVDALEEIAKMLTTEVN